ncbi:hypothetical protein SOASR030_02630 [Leminorella grimontii]|uniref:Uncharacterized protein n=1 Tax=Leminorella grimontii TaxID=82981 RepID=A0AAV5N064_9GAMM|nr:hypothetical protein [Leminorella grimontii]KFC95669.1 hypothetical protein GLGR_1832 [Leminorella grimontii ATCC 33999 = DSM 5078]GKX54151.1 hypothetical protein SOASR030_02630 [Leminorella grimontii]
MTTISQKAAREMLGMPENFSGGVYVTKNGVSELFIQTAAEREAELAAQASERQSNALLKLVMLSRQDIAEQKTMTPEEALKRRRQARGY